jgi:hypothetical protein
MSHLVLTEDAYLKIAGIMLYVLLSGLIALICRIKLFVSHYQLSWWKAIIPIVYEISAAGKLVGPKKKWWGLLLFVPIAGYVWILWFYMTQAEKLNRGILLGLLTAFFPLFFMPVLAFSKKTKYIGEW